MKRFTARLEPVPHGGLFVVVPAAIAGAARLTHGNRVRGAVNGAGYRSSVMKYSGIFHLGVHKATATQAAVVAGDRVQVTIELDDEPLPTDQAPDDLLRALSREPRARSSWEALAPAVRRGYVKTVVEAKRDETRARRVTAIVATLREGVPKRRTWSPKKG